MFGTRTHRIAERGHALFLSLVTMTTLVGLGATVLTLVNSSNREARSQRAQVERLSIADSGIRAAVQNIANGGDGALGSRANPVAMGAGAYWTLATDHGDGTHTVRSYGTHQGRERALEVRVVEEGHVFHHAIYAGNSSDDPTYVMDFGGRGASGDLITGDIYSGGSLRRWGDANLTGDIRVRDSAIGVVATEGVTQPEPDFDTAWRSEQHIVDVARAFDEEGQWRRDDAGGRAWQLPRNHLAHFLRKNPNDRRTEIDATPADDYFIEDPYERVRTDLREDGSDAYEVSLHDNRPLVVYVEGNLWIHNNRTYSMRIKAPGNADCRVTFIVRGNIYVSDNMFYGDSERDGVALIALRDEEEADSGNIYFGDPRFGTLQHMDAFMFAENDFHDNNLSATGSKDVTLNGVMSAGNHVAIQRTVGTSHSRLEVQWDERLQDGRLSLPGIPTSTESSSYRIVGWREVSSYLENAPDGA